MTPRSRLALLATPTLAAVLALCGCAAPVPPTAAILTYETVPAGATIYQGKEVLGVAPVSRSYEANGKAQITTPDVTAVWPSGAKTTFFTILNPGDDRVATLQRPVDAPNLALDQANADKVNKEQEKDKSRMKEQQLRDQKRNSAACLQQQSGQGIKSPIDLCN